MQRKSKLLKQNPNILHGEQIIRDCIIKEMFLFLLCYTCNVILHLCFTHGSSILILSGSTFLRDYTIYMYRQLDIVIVANNCTIIPTSATLLIDDILQRTYFKILEYCFILHFFSTKGFLHYLNLKYVG